MSPHTPLVIAHRGASGYRPEHSRGAYELAVALGADAVEPDLVATRDGVLVVRHENEISGTTDVAEHAEFRDRRTTREVDGEPLTGWFTEDFTWAELQALTCRERIPRTRPSNVAFDGRMPLLRLRDVLTIVDAATAQRGTEVGVVAELKHATHFDAAGLPLDELFAAELDGWQGALTIESFEQTVLDRMATAGAPGRRVYLVEASGSPADLVAAHGRAARSYSDHLTPDGLAALAAVHHGVSLDKALVVRRDTDGAFAGTTDVVERVHAAGLDAFVWTLRPENAFLPTDLRRGTARDRLGEWRREFTAVMATGVDGVFADHPDLAIDARADLLARADAAV